MNISSTASPIGVSGTDSAIGYGACLISCLAFGTMFVPLRNKESRDGMFVQWVQCSVVFLFGFSINIIRWFPKCEPIPAIGGLLYATGNVFSVPIVDGIGVGLGMLIWGSIQVMVGWSVARFGLPFSLLDSSPVEHNGLNYAGMIITLICVPIRIIVSFRIGFCYSINRSFLCFEVLNLLDGFLFLFVRHEKTQDTVYEVETAEKTDSTLESTHEKERENSEQTDGSFTVVLRKLPYIAMAVCLGILHGLMMCPIDIIKKKHPSSDSYKVLDYCFSYFSTVFFFSTLYFIGYCIIRREKVYIKKELVLPSIFYGILWNIGMTLWFISSDKLQQTVAYPITTRLPAIIGALTDVFVYKSIRGRSNVGYLAFVVLLGIAGVVLIAISNQKF